MGLEALANHEAQSRDRVVETLKFYGNPDNYDRINGVKVLEDEGAKAREILRMMGETV